MKTLITMFIVLLCGNAMGQSTTKRGEGVLVKSKDVLLVEDSATTLSIFEKKENDSTISFVIIEGKPVELTVTYDLETGENVYFMKEEDR